MRLANSAHGWGLVHIVLHWATAALIGWAAWLGWTMTDLPRFDPATFVTYNLHKSLGVTILLLAALRLVWRVSRKRPAPPPAMRPIERRLAGVTHASLFALLFLVPVLGWLTTAAADVPVDWFGLVVLPQPIDAAEPWREWLEDAHWLAAMLLLALVALHVAGALKHQLIDGDDVLRRMIVPTRE